MLASSSPRRAELLAAAGFAFEVLPADVDETPHPNESPEQYVERIALAKAEAVDCRKSGIAVLGADTTVAIDSMILGKPADSEDAARILRMLAGKTHRVLTGVAVRAGSRTVSSVDVSTVRFSSMTETEIAWYAATGEPEGKAGAYAIQGRASRFVERIEGSYSNVVGLPVQMVYRLLKQIGYRE